MNSWKKILTIVILVIAILAIGGVLLYNLVIVPKYIEPVLTHASTLLKDSEIQDAITDLAEDLADKGVIDDETFDNYMRQAKKYTSDVRSNISGNTNSDDDLMDDLTESGARIETGSDDTSITVAASSSSLGISKVKTIDGRDETAKVNDSYSQTFSDTDLEDDNWGEELDDKYSLDDAVNANDEVPENLSAHTKAESLYKKVLNAMTLHERSVFFSVIGKADTSKLISLYQTSDKSGAKEYLKSILDSAEYSEAVSIFFKYAPLLLEN